MVAHITVPSSEHCTGVRRIMIIRMNSVKEIPDQIQPKSASWRTSVSLRPLKWILSVSVFALLLLSDGFGDERWEVPPPGQPAQMWSRVDYNPKLTDPFFESNDWSYRSGGKVHATGRTPEGEDSPRPKYTAMCFSNSLGGMEHLVEFCDAGLLGVNMIDLFIQHTCPGYADRLRVRIRNGMFTCQYWTLFIRLARTRPAAIWTTKRQKLTLDKKVYRKGDVVKGRIDFECVQEITDDNLLRHYSRKPTTIKVYGVFKTIVE